MGRQRRRPDACEHGARHEEGGVEGRGADEDVAAHAGQRPHQGGAWAAVVGGRTQQLAREGRAHARLRDHGSPGRAGEPPVEAVDEQDLEHDVRQVRHHDDLQRPPQVRDAAQVALARQSDQRERQAARADAQIEDRQAAGPVAAAEGMYRGLRERQREQEQHDADARGQPEGLGRQPPGHHLLARPVVASHLRGGAVGQEVEEREAAGEQRGGQRQRGQLRGAEVADDRGVGQDVERLGGKCAERGERERQDLAVVRGAPEHPPQTRRL